MSDNRRLEIIERKQAGDAHPTPILFVHGAWCWDEVFLPYFTEQGFHVKALSLRGHGKSQGRERLRTTRISEYVADVHDVVKSFSTPPVLVGHSMGGMIVRKYLESTSRTPFSKEALLASVPPYGFLETTLSILANHSLVFMQVNLTMKLYPIIATVERSQECFFSPDMPREQQESYFSRLQNESYLGFLDTLLFNLPKPKKVKAPVMVLGAENDTIFSVRDVEAAAADYHTNARIFANIAHDMKLEKEWQKVADHIIENL